MSNKPRLTDFADEQPQLTERAPSPRYDILIVSGRAGYRAAGGALRTLVQMLAFRGFAQPYDEAIAKDWLEIYMKPGPAGHEIWNEHAHVLELPVYNEGIVRADERGFTAPFGGLVAPLYFSITFYGCVYKEPLGPFRKLMMDSLNLRIAVYTQPAGEIPSRSTVGDDEKPEEKKKRERGNGVAGTEVDEW